MSSPVTFEPVSTVSVAVSTSSAQSAVVGAANQPSSVRQTVRLLSTVPAAVAFGTSPTAVAASSMELAANIPEYFDMVPGQRIAAIRAPSATADGVLKITLMQKATY